MESRNHPCAGEEPPVAPAPSDSTLPLEGPSLLTVSHSAPKTSSHSMGTRSKCAACQRLKILPRVVSPPPATSAHQTMMGSGKGSDPLVMDPPASVLGNKVEYPFKKNPTISEDDEFWPLSGKPYFDVVLTKSHVKPGYHLVFPAKMTPVLPSTTVPAVVTYRGKTWETIFYGDRASKRFDVSWKNFVNDNDLKVGDALVFELVDSSTTLVKFRVQILRGDFPSELLEKVNESGETSDNPIVIE
ncbi:hypothetical protein RJ639_006543 [Escallonia herrerae]|uniref:TF-B3 domain-containing protein n=1 Tax=Escallonia herrerae TaxID=1293975 RepID=A0AA88W1F5_9ASTE|nr:hypothetical protein RJ639_006543 [Escallonia herrerae]